MPVNEKFIINLKGKSFVTYEGLLDLAHQNNLKSIDVELVQLPTGENDMTAVCKATATTEDRSFTDFGDASPRSVNSKIVPHLIRMASTRAKARTLRDLTNVGITAIEELNLEEEDEEPDPLNDYYRGKDVYNEEPPTHRQVETIKKLASQTNMEIDMDTLTKRTAGTLISKLLDQRYKKH